MSKHFLLIYDYVADILERRGPYRPGHLKAAFEAVDRGEMLLGGALAEPTDGAVFLFKGETAAVADGFMSADPYMANGLVTAWRVREWGTVLGESALSRAPRPD